MALSHRLTVTALFLGVLASLAAGLPHDRQTTSPLAVEAESPHMDQSFVHEVTPRGDMVRREALASAGLAQKRAAGQPADITQDGAVTVVSPAETKSEQLKLEELTEECMQEEPTAECMEKFGSYGVRKLFTENWENIKKLKYQRPGWMSHPEVQKRKLFELTLPGTISSGTYAITGEDAAAAGITPYGVVSQNLDFYQQLELGFRMFDLRVAYSPEHSLVYASHGALMVPLSTLMKDLRRFLEEHEREVIILDVKKDDNADPSHLRPLTDEESTKTRIPGQLVHEAIECELKEMLATYKVLSQLPNNNMAENPTVGALTDAGVHVVYFWDTQQVLCTSFNECKQTPGWHPPGAGFPFAFGPPYVFGTRINVTGGRQSARIIEPACHTHSGVYTQDEQPEQLLKKIKTFATDMQSKTLESRPKCFPVGASLPPQHSPPIWYTIDGFVTSSPEEQQVQSDRMRGVKAIYTRGEGFTAKTDAERTNYLMLSWFLKRDNQEVFTKANGIMFEFAGAAYMPMLRMIEAMQARPECGWAIYCKSSGSCWADTLLGAKDNCLDEDEVLKVLKEHADGKEDDMAWVMYVTIFGVSCLCLLGICGGISYIVNMMNPKKPKEAEQALVENEDDDAQSSLPGSEAASDYGDRPADEVNAARGGEDAP